MRIAELWKENLRKVIAMSLTYKNISKRPEVFLKLFGVSPLEVQEIIDKVHPLWERQIIGCYKRPGRNFKLTLEDMFLILLLYYRSCTTQIFLAFVFGIDDSRVCRIIKKLEPILAQVVCIKKDRILSQQDVEYLINATE